MELNQVDATNFQSSFEDGKQQMCGVASMMNSQILDIPAVAPENDYVNNANPNLVSMNSKKWNSNPGVELDVIARICVYEDLNVLLGLPPDIAESDANLNTDQSLDLK